jgi:predicted Zn-dependent protease
MVQRYYDSNSETIPDLYAHAIMHYRQKDYDQAIELFNAILVKEPNNPAILEMKAQTYRDSGQLEKARVIYEESLAAYDTPAPLVKANLAQVLTGLGDYGLEVENLLLSALAYNKNESYIYRLLATVKGRNDREADARYYLAEEAAMLGNRAEAKRLLSLALADDTLDDTLAVKAQDLQKYLDSLPKG